MFQLILGSIIFLDIVAHLFPFSLQPSVPKYPYMYPYLYRCDQETAQDYCFPIPYTYCEKQEGGPSCKWVQKQVCRKEPSPGPIPCDQNSACMTCDQFRRGPGFASCPTNTCPTYIPGKILKKTP